METASRFNDTKLIWFMHMHLRINSFISFMFPCITPIRSVLVNFIFHKGIRTIFVEAAMYRR